MLSDPRIVKADLEIARPGESVRVTTVNDVIEPRIKVEGPGTVYPGVAGRSVTAVGQGVTHRLQGVTVVEVAEVLPHDGLTGNAWPFIDMSGPMAEVSPYGSLHHVCLVMEVDSAISTGDKNDATQGAALLVADRLAAATTGLNPPDREVFELNGADSALPRVVYIGCFNSPEHYSNSVSARGTAIYGLTRLTPPWPLHPNELIDGALCGKSTWTLANNPVVFSLYRGHGDQFNFAGCIAIRTRWSSQAEKDVTSFQAAKLASMLGATGAIVTWDAGGNDFMEVIRTVQACERLGVKTVFLTNEEHPDTGGPPLLEPLPEADAIVSTGFGANLTDDERPLPAVERVIGKKELVLTDDPHAPERVVPANSSLPGWRGGDRYGFTKASSFEY